jgi:signal peptidase I
VRNLRMLAILLLALAGTELLRTHVAEPYTVAQTSMEPHLNEGDRLVVNKLAFRTGEPSRGDVVVFDSADVPGSAGAPETTLVKRVIGLPGEVVQALDGHVVIDGEVIDDPWSDGKATAAFGPTRVPDGMVYVLGDNRGLSVDSRTFGSVPIDSLIGRVEAIIWPAPRVGRV